MQTVKLPENQVKKISCLDCEQRSTCRKLCEAASEYADQDKVNLREKTVSDITWSGEWPEGESEQKLPNLTDREIVLSTLMISKVPHKLIRKVLKLRSNTYWNALHKLKKKMYK